MPRTPEEEEAEIAKEKQETKEKLKRKKEKQVALKKKQEVCFISATAINC